MKRRQGLGLCVFAAIAIVSPALNACSKPSQSSYRTMSDSAVRVDALTPPKKAPAPSVAASSIAYTYTYGLEAPAQALAPLMHRHQASCAAAGPSQCQLLNSELHTGDMPGATLNIRGAPDWLARFRANLGADARDAGGRIVQDDTSAEDLTRSLVDTQATVRAETALRDRLQALLETRPGRLSDLLDVEKALASAQGELDATQSELMALQGRVQMSKLTLTYATAASRSQATNPLAAALASSGRTFLASLAMLIGLAAALAPWIVVVGAAFGAWLIWTRRSRRVPAAGPVTAPK